MKTITTKETTDYQALIAKFKAPEGFSIESFYGVESSTTLNDLVKIELCYDESDYEVRSSPVYVISTEDATVVQKTLVDPKNNILFRK